uniref:RNA polymerase II elongation factor ELL N-terminal domain-containing protein n=1 Tax=Mola mola TaxID=94237 RepID=A0A3Q3VW80_MOLML
MAALKEEQCYGLSCGRVSNGSNVSVFHVKLTDSALRAFEGYRSGKVSGTFSVLRHVGSRLKVRPGGGEVSPQLGLPPPLLSRRVTQAPGW